jgi:1A family penicillin-binding protein
MIFLLIIYACNHSALKKSGICFSERTLLPLDKPFHQGFFKNIGWRKIGLLLSLLISGSLLCALYFPLPVSRMPVVSEVYDCHHQLLTTFFIENRRPVKLNEVPPFLRQAFLAVEDHRFYQHHGINPGRILKAAWRDLTERRLVEGASTITQQLARNAYLNQKRTLTRKIKELFYTVKLELHLSKDSIFELYLNQIYFGHGAYGLKVAAETYFNKNLPELNQAEMALLAGLSKGPAYFSPYINIQAARKRTLEVLQRMVRCGYITPAELEIYRRQNLRLSGLRTPKKPAPYFLDRLQDEVAKIFPKDPGVIFKAGLRIESTLDPKLQHEAEQAMDRGLPKLFKDASGLPQPQGALIAVNPENGEILALVGGTDILKSQFNRATQAKRQPGSAFKPVLYATALESGYTLASQFDRTPVTYTLGTHTYRPLDKNDERTSGFMSLRDALASSSNVISVKLLNLVGIEPVVKAAQNLGINSHLPKLLSLALGTGELTPLELTTAYIPFANGGLKYLPTTIRRITDQNGQVLYQAPRHPTPVIKPGVAYLVTQALTGVLKNGGTAANIGNSLGRPAAGKTGTSEENLNAWFLGFTPELLCCVYVGCDHNERSLPGAANRIAAPIWAGFMANALAGQPPRDFQIPKEITNIEICKETGALATTFCPKETEFFLTGTEPTAYCTKHRFIDLEICGHSGMLPGPYCRFLEVRRFNLGEQPKQICNICKKRASFFQWLRRIFDPSE